MLNGMLLFKQNVLSTQTAAAGYAAWLMLCVALSSLSNDQLDRSSHRRPHWHQKGLVMATRNQALCQFRGVGVKAVGTFIRLYALLDAFLDLIASLVGLKVCSQVDISS